MMNWVDNLVSKIYVDALELSVASVAFFWGFWLLLPGDTFGTTATYLILSEIAPEWCIGILMMTLGLLQTIALAREQDRLIGLFALLAFVCWTIIALAFLFSNPAGTAFVIYGHVAVGNAIITVRYRNEK